MKNYMLCISSEDAPETSNGPVQLTLEQEAEVIAMKSPHLKPGFYVIEAGELSFDPEECPDASLPCQIEGVIEYYTE